MVSAWKDMRQTKKGGFNSQKNGFIVRQAAEILLFQKLRLPNTSVRQSPLMGLSLAERVTLPRVRGL